MTEPPFCGESDEAEKAKMSSCDGLNNSSKTSENSRDSAFHFLRALQVSAEQHERFLKLEFKAKKAYEFAVNLAPPSDPINEKLVEQIANVLSEVRMEELTKRLDQNPPKVDLLPHLFELAHRSLLDALPVRLHERVMEDLRTSMSWNENSIFLGSSVSRITIHLKAIVGKVVKYGAAGREEKLKEELSLRCRDIDNCKPTVGKAVAEGFRFLFSSIRQLHEDIAEHSLLLVSEDLRRNAVQYIRTFLTTCLPPVRTWKSSIDFLKNYADSPEVNDWMVSPQLPDSRFLSSAQLRVRGALLFGMVDLLRSGGRNAANRWSDLPLEIFYFDKALIFSAANTIQEATLLLLLEGAISSIFKGKGGSSIDTTAMLHRLHSKIMNLFSQDIRLDDLKCEVIHFIYNALSPVKDEESVKRGYSDGSIQEPHCSHERQKDEGESRARTGLSTPTPFSTSRSSLSFDVSFSPEEEQMILSVIDKMANTEDSLYISFEKKVLSYLSFRLRKREDNLAPLGLITASLDETGALLSRGLKFHWEVFTPFYNELIPLLELP